MIDGYGERRGLTAGHIVALSCVAMLSGSIVFAGFVVLRLVQPASPPVAPAPLPVVDASAPLAADPAFASLTARATQSLAGDPQSDTVAELCWGLAEAVESAGPVLASPRALAEAASYAGRMTFAGGEPLTSSAADAMQGLLLEAVGEDPSAITEERRGLIVRRLRAIAYGALQAGG